MEQSTFTVARQEAGHVIVSLTPFRFTIVRSGETILPAGAPKRSWPRRDAYCHISPRQRSFATNPSSLIQSIAEVLMHKAAIGIPRDYLDGDLSSFVLKATLENYEAAKQDRRAVWGDTGVPRWFVKLGNETQVEGGMVALEAALRRTTVHATKSVPLRLKRVRPLWRTVDDNNVGVGAPGIEHGFEPDGASIDLVTLHQGGLFGTDYRMLFPSDSIRG